MSWSRMQVQLLIDLYKEHPCLYAVKHGNYKNKHARNDALSRICMEVAKVRPGATIADCKNKFSNIRTNFLIQYRKYSDSFSSGMGENEIFKPNLWYFDTMKFILEHSIPRESVDSVPQSSLQDTSSKNSSGCDELSTEELFPPTLSDHQFEIYHTDCENDNQASGVI
ncbi:hypothetical protein ABEB36_007946 [Hypothenemus hampei]|uniref:MADF domain-containing protein n=1 Tax=Hypothenemus hampei TaxID=57062 RepID=A0ABD1EWA0_HYPHA